MDRKEYDVQVRQMLEYLTAELLEFRDAAWQIITEQRFQEQLNEDFVFDLILDRLEKIYIEHRKQDRILDSAYDILNSDHSLQ